MKRRKPKIKITIKALPKTQVQDGAWARKTWVILRNAIEEVYRKNASYLSFEELYRNAYNMVLYKFGGMLYKNIQETTSAHLGSVGIPIADAHEDQLLEQLDNAWKDHKASMNCIRDILMYMDRVHVPHHAGLLPVYDLGLQLFRERVVRHSKVSERLQARLLQLVHRERNGEVIDKGLFKNMTVMLTDLGINSRAVYETDFEQPFLRTSAQFYHTESQLFIQTNTMADYMTKVEGRLREETLRVQHYLDSGTEPKIRAVLEEHLIAAHQDTIIGEGLVPMLQDHMLPDLAAMYRLLARVEDGLTRLRTAVAEHVYASGRALCEAEQQSQAPKTRETFIRFVDSLLDLKRKYDEIVVTCFAGDKNFVFAVTGAFERFMNLSSSTPQYMSLYIDDRLKKGMRGTEQEIDQVLNNVITLFRFLQDKDVFEKYYKQHLSKRLLEQKSSSEDIERAMIAKLKMECGYQFTSKLEGMFQDMKTGADTMDEFREWQAEQPTLPIALNVQVLTTTYWPISQAAAGIGDLILPASLLNATQAFRRFYASRHDGRKLTWLPHVGHCELSAVVGKCKRTLTCSVYQAMILMLFNDAERLTVQDIIDKTGLNMSILQGHLLAMALAKNKDLRILRKRPSSKAMKVTDELYPSSKWKPKLRHVRLATLGAAKARDREAEVTRQKIAEERNVNIDACIVRIMKSRNALSHKELILEVVKLLVQRFKPSSTNVKKRIESLIQREYLERAPNDPSMYHYLA